MTTTAEQEPTKAGEPTMLNVGLVEITEPMLVNGETRQVSIGPRIVILVGKESGILTADVARSVAERLVMLADEADRMAKGGVS